MDSSEIVGCQVRQVQDSDVLIAQRADFVDRTAEEEVTIFLNGMADQVEVRRIVLDEADVDRHGLIVPHVGRAGQ